ncbi:hypothetical protein BGZ98_004994 [Dissophora globulifera]|nr:hypothetical protein BGZ98_004994 [Dissophora globulifera]
MIAFLVLYFVFLPGIYSEPIYDSIGDRVGTGRNYKLRCAQGNVTLDKVTSTWEFLRVGTGPELVVKFCKPFDCSRGHDVVDSKAYHFYIYKPRGPGYATIAYTPSSGLWWVVTNSASAASPIMIEGSKDHYLIQQSDYWWTIHSSNYLVLEAKTVGQRMTCSFVYAGEDFGFRGFEGMNLQ